MTDEELRKLMDEWVNRLGLQSWKIKLLTKQKADEMSEQGSDGCVDYAECSRTARIELLDPDCYGERVIPYDEEKTLVHELLHLKMSLFFEADPLMERVAHMILNDIAEALVDAKKSVEATEQRAIGKWVLDNAFQGTYRCSLCNHIAPEGISWYFCPVCGADMRKKDGTAQV